MIKLGNELYKAVQRNLGEGLLLSGGLDSSVVALLAPDSKALTVALESYGDDIKYAELVAKFLKLKHHKKIFTINEAFEAIPEVIKILRTFDPAIPNDISIYFGLKFAKEQGIRSVMTGDGCDELFAGYHYMHNLKNLDYYISKIANTMYFSSNRLGRYLEIEIKQPYLDKEFINFAMNIPPDLKVKNDNGKTQGKWIIRKTFENVLPKEVIWRNKMAIEYGSGTTMLREFIASKISNEKFRKKQRMYPIRFRNKEHLFYYEIYRDVVGEIPLPKEGEKQCCKCGAGVPLQSSHCRICGAFPV